MSTTGRKWKPGQAKRFRATMAARRKAKATAVSTDGLNHRDAILYLQHAESFITKGLETRRLKKMDHAHLLTLLALTVLRGE